MAETLRSILKRRGWSLAELSRQSGIHYTTFRTWFALGVEPKTPSVRLIALTLGLPEKRVRKAIAAEASQRQARVAGQ